jgi:hypothetical protein
MRVDIVYGSLVIVNGKKGHLCSYSNKTRNFPTQTIIAGTLCYLVMFENFTSQYIPSKDVEILVPIIL